MKRIVRVGEEERETSRSERRSERTIGEEERGRAGSCRIELWRATTEDTRVWRTSTWFTVPINESWTWVHNLKIDGCEYSQWK